MVTKASPMGLREQRAALGASLDTVARWSRVSKASLARYEAGERVMPPIVARTVAKGLRGLGATDVTAGDLFSASVKTALAAGGVSAVPAVTKSLAAAKEDGEVSPEMRATLARIVEELRRLVSAGGESEPEDGGQALDVVARSRDGVGRAVATKRGTPQRDGLGRRRR